jgi:hypothetical protein
VFFDALGFKWEYEPQGYSLPGGGAYLPDFWISDHELFVEVKPDGGDFTKAIEFGKASDRRIWLAEGTPDFSWYCVRLPIEEGYFSIESPVEDGGTCRMWWEDGCDEFVPKRNMLHSWGTPYQTCIGDGDRVFNAILKARGVRFEHGESPC